MTRSSAIALLLAAVGAAPVTGADRGLPLPPAPVRVVIPDVRAFEGALTGSYRQALEGDLPEGDKVAAGFRQSQVGAKLEDQWARLGTDLSWTWADLAALRPRRLGVALLSPGSLEAVLVVDTPLAALPTPLPPGTAKTHGGVSYALVTRGSGDGSADDRRMGLAWARHAGLLFLATSERALLLALDEAAAGRGFEPALSGLVSMALDLDALGQDRYFKREFLFGPADSGRIDTALRLEGAKLVEVRQGQGRTEGQALAFEAAGFVASAWEPVGAGAWPALRAALLEPIPDLLARPVPPTLPLPATMPAAEDRFLVSIEKPKAGPAAAWDEGDVEKARALFERAGVRGYGYAVDASRNPLLLVEWPGGLMGDLERAVRATLSRRAGPVTAVEVRGATELRVGPDLPALAWKRAGTLVWFAPSARSLAELPVVRTEADVVRWARLDLRAARAEGVLWAKAEGPGSPENVRPFADRILGLLGWMPEVTSLHVERRVAPGGWSERVEFGPPSP
jgi:hypothetical protein